MSAGSSIQALRKTVAVDLNPATREVATGTEVYAREVGSRLPGAAPDLRWLFFGSRARSGLGVDMMVVPMARLWSQVRLPLALQSAHPDLLFVPAHAIPFGWLGKSLTAVHDLAFERHPQAYSLAERSYLQLTTRWAALRCPLLIAPSESTRRDLVDLYHVAPERVRVVPLGGGERGEREAAPAKRLAELGLAGDLVLSKRLRASSRCRVLGPVDAPTLELLYQRAKAVVVPSLYEGFGLPVLEAMARGQVVVAARASSLPEVGGDAALYVDDPNDPEELAGALQTAIGDLKVRARLTRAARKQAAGFTWDRCAAGVVEVIRELLL